MSEGCAHCYAEAGSRRNPRVLGVWGPNGTRSCAADDYVEQPFAWDAAARRAGLRKGVFCASLADVLEDWKGDITNHKGVVVPGLTMDHLRYLLYATIWMTPNLDWMLLTKRPQNVRGMMAPGYTANAVGHVVQRMGSAAGQRFYSDFWPPRNLWLGTTTENNARMKERVGYLRDYRVDVNFLSCEPLLEDVSGTLAAELEVQRDCPACAPRFGRLTVKADCLRCKGTGKVPPVDWVIVGGESSQGGAEARPFDYEGADSIVGLCAEKGVACFVKQLGSRPVAAGLGRRLKDGHGGEIDEWPPHLRVRQLPDPATGGVISLC